MSFEHALTILLLVGGLMIIAAIDRRTGGGRCARRQRRKQFRQSAEPVVPGYIFTDAKARCAGLEERLRRLEGTVTSREFQMDRELRNAGRS